MKTNFTPNYPDESYTATIKLTCTRKEISALYDMLQDAEPWLEIEMSVKKIVLNELRAALDWITEMEDIHSSLQKNKK